MRPALMLLAMVVASCAPPVTGCSCDAPPSSVCVGNAVRTWAPQGTCSAGSCSYAFTDTACASGCSNATCSQAIWPSGTTSTLRAVWGASATDVWAAGDDVVLHFDGTAWSPKPGAPSGTFTTLTGTSSTDVWLFDSRAGAAWHWDGATFSNIATVAGATAFWPFGLANVWFLTTSTIMIWDGVSVKSALGPMPQPASLAGVWASSPSVVFMFAEPHALYSWSATHWVTESFTATTPPLSAVFGSSETNVWLVGSSFIFQLVGTTWVPTSPTTATLTSGSTTGATDVWVAGTGGALLHFDGTAWSPLQSGTTQNLNGVWASSPGGAWAVGVGGTIVHQP